MHFGKLLSLRECNGSPLGLSFFGGDRNVPELMGKMSHVACPYRAFIHRRTERETRAAASFILRDVNR